MADQFAISALDSLGRIVEAFRGRFGQEVEKALRIKFAGAKCNAMLARPSKPDVQIGNVFMTPIRAMFRFLIPLWIFRPIIHRHFDCVIGREIGENLCCLGSPCTDIVS